MNRKDPDGSRELGDKRGLPLKSPRAAESIPPQRQDSGHGAEVRSAPQPARAKIKSTAMRAPHDGVPAGDLGLRDRVRHRLVDLDTNLRLRLGVIVGR